MAALRPSAPRSPDVTVSGYPQIYPRETAEQNGIGIRRKYSPQANRIFAALTCRCRDLATHDKGVSVTGGCPRMLLDSQIITRGVLAADAIDQPSHRRPAGTSKPARPTAFSMTVVSTITRLAIAALITPARFAASIVSASSSSTPASPSRLRQHVRRAESIGGSVYRYVLPVNTCQHGLSTRCRRPLRRAGQMRAADTVDRRSAWSMSPVAPFAV